MRDRQTGISQSEVRNLASLFSSNLVALIKIFRLFRDQGLKIPPSCAVEVQHICMHMSALTEPAIAENLASIHFQSAIGHSKRALLDAYKEFIFQKIESLNADQVKRFAECRVSELREGFTYDYSNTISRYNNLLNDALHPDNSPQIIKEIGNTFYNPSYWKEVKIWLELDLLLSVLSEGYKKDASLLQQLIESLIFDENKLRLNPSYYLYKANIQQKLKIIVYLFRDQDLYNDFLHKKKYSQEIIEQAKSDLERLHKTKSNNFCEFEALCSKIFPLISNYFNLKYA